MAGGKKTKWRKVAGAGAAQMLDNLPLKARAEELDRKNQLFIIDTEGTDATSHLSHGARRLLERRQLLIKEIRSSSSSSNKRALLEVATKGHKQQLLRVLKSRRQRQEAEAKRRAQEAAANEVDLWADEPVQLQPSKKRQAAAAAAAAGRIKRRRCRLEDLRSLVPAVVPPKAGVSYNPSVETQQQQLIAAAAAAVLQQHEGRSAKAVLQGCTQQKEQQLQLQQQLLLQQQDPLNRLRHKQPVTAALLQHLPAEKVMALTAEDKQRLLLELAVTGNVSLEGKGDALDAAEGDAEGAEESESIPRELAKQPKKKTRADRNRQRRHEQQMRRAAAKHKQKAFRKAIDSLPQLLQELQQEHHVHAEARAKRDAGEAAKEEAARQGVVAIKIGRRKFLGAPVDAALPGEVTGSLRTTKVQSAAAAAAERLASLHRRGMLELPAQATGAHAARVKKQLRKVRSSRKVLKKDKGAHAV